MEPIVNPLVVVDLDILMRVFIVAQVVMLVAILFGIITEQPVLELLLVRIILL